MESRKSRLNNSAYIFLPLLLLALFLHLEKRKDLENSDRHFDDATRMCNLTATAEINSSITSDKRNLA